MSQFVTPTELRARIVAAVLEHFQRSMPIYQQMIDVARDINQAAGEETADRLGRIMHAAIRCACPSELKTIARIMAVIGCFPVNYYDLREKVSVQSTAFRPTDLNEIKENGFRLFCSMLSMDCIDEKDQPFVQSIIDRRNLFSDEFLGLIQAGLNQGLISDQADSFVNYCVTLFIRPQDAMVSIKEFERLQSINKVAAQVLVSNSLAFNHLTPSVASVPTAHEIMQQRGIATIPVWQGPVGLDVILRQTSCLAPPVKVRFADGAGGFVEQDYQETFIEFEQRLQALTRIGRQQFERMFAAGKRLLTMSESDDGYASHYYQVMGDALASFPTKLQKLWKQGLGYFTFHLATADEGHARKRRRSLKNVRFDDLIDDGTILLLPQTYEDFFGPAATNIFNSNIGLDDVTNVGISKTEKESLADFEKMIGSPLLDMYDYYDAIQAASKHQVLQQLASYSS